MIDLMVIEERDDGTRHVMGPLKFVTPPSQGDEIIVRRGDQAVALKVIGLQHHADSDVPKLQVIVSDRRG